MLVLHGAGKIFVGLDRSYFLVPVSNAGVTRRVVTPPATSSTDGWRIVDGCSLLASPTMVPEISFSPLVGYPKWKV